MAVDIAKLGFRVESLEMQLAAERAARMAKESRKAETAAERLARQTDKLGKSMSRMGRSLTLYVTTPILGAAAAAVKLGASFDSTLTKMNTLVGVSRSELGKFRKEILKLAPSVGRGPRELADALFAITSAGQRGAQAMDTLEKAAKASAIGLGDTRTVALSATAAVQAYGKSNMDSTKALEILIGTIEQGNLAAEELAPVLGRVIGIAAQMGVSFEDLGAFIAVFTRLGVNADEAATALRGTLAGLQIVSPAAAKTFRELGTSVEEVRRQIQEEGFIVAFQQLVRLAQQTDTDVSALIPNVRALSGVLGVFAGEGDVAVEVAEAIGDAVGTMEERFAAVEELDPTFAFQKMKAELEAMFIEISVDLLPVVLDLVNGLKELVAEFRALEPEVQKSYVKMALLAAAIGPLAIVLGNLLRVIGFLIPRLAVLAAALGPVGWIALGAGAAAAALYALADSGDDVTASFDLLATQAERLNTELGLRNAIAGAQQNLEMLRAQADALKEEWLELEELRELASLGGTGGPEDMRDIGFSAEQQARMDEILATLKELDAVILAQQQRLEGLRDRHHEVNAEAKLTDTVMNDLFNTLEKMGAGGFGLPPGGDDAPAFDEETFEKLLDYLDPSIKATEEFYEAWNLLKEAFDFGKIKSIDELRRLQRELKNSEMWTAAFGKTLGNLDLKELDVQTAATLQWSFDFVDGLKELDDGVQQLARQFTPLEAGLKDLAAARELVNKAWDMEVLTDPEQFDALIEGIDRAEAALRNMNDTFLQGMQESIAALEQVRGLFNQDSAEAEALNEVLRILNVIMGINAVIKQLSEGDVYSAIPRALGVAALIASMGVDTGAAGGGNTRSLQETQGTGTVLGDAEAKSESILRASEITADATSELVGINRGMLNALQRLEVGITGATVQIARGAASPDFGGALVAPQNWLVDLHANILDWIGLGDLFRSIFGGKSKVLDEGIQIVGDTLANLTNEVMVRAFQRYKEKKHLFDDYDEYTRFGDVDDEVGRQFALVFESMRDTVMEAALALGVSIDDINRVLDTYSLEDINISLKDLEGDEIREELEAVFGAVFDDLAMAVVPFIEDFQQVGEGLGETLVRVATSVQVMQEAVKALGFAADESDPEAFAHMAVGLVELTGGVDEFITQFTTFFDRFASDEQQFEFASSQLSRAFESVGLAIPDARDGMIDLMRSLDASTEAGQRQIAMLLETADVADTYFDLLERRQEGLLDAAEAAPALRETLANFVGSRIYAPLLALREGFEEAMDAADALNATQREYAMIARSFNNQLRRMAAELTISVLSLAEQLFGAEAQALQEGVVGGLEDVREVANDVFTDWQRALEDIYEFTQSLLLDEQLTTLTPAEQLAEAQRQFDRTLAAALAGDVEAAAALPDAAQALLEEARFMFASGEQYQRIFDQVLAALDSVQMPAGIPETVVVEDDTPGAEDQTPQQQMISELERMLTAMDLAGALRDLSQVLNVSVLGLMAELGVPLRDLVDVLGLELHTLTEETASELADIAMMLGANVFDLMDALGVNLDELAAASGVHLQELSQELAGNLGDFAAELGANVIDLAQQLGVSIADLARTFDVGVDSFSAEQFQALVAFSNALGTNIQAVADELALNLGDLRDATSILSEALELAIGDLPEGIQADLGPLLENIRNATEGADANDAIQDLGEYVLELPDDLAAALLPFLELIGFQQIAPDLVALHGIEENTAATVAAIHALIETMGGEVPTTPVPEPVVEPDPALPKPTTPTTGGPGDVETPITDPGVVITTSPDPALPPETTLPPPTEPITDPSIMDVIMSMIGGYAEGGMVPRTGLAQLHAGEFVVTKNADNLNITSTGNNMSSEELAEIRAVLVDIREQDRRYQEQDLDLSREMEGSMKTQAETARRVANA